MQIKKSLLVAGAIATIGIASTAVGVKAATARDSTSDKNSIVQKLAERFNLNQEDVQKVFDEDRSAHEAEHQAKLEERLSQAVKDGKITEDQKTKILAKIAEMKASMESTMDTMKDKTHEERKTLMEQKRADLETWAKENNIPPKYLMFLHVKGSPGPRGPGHGGEFRMHIEDGEHTSREDT